MSNRTWTYTGNISGYAQQKNLRDEWIITEIELGDMSDRNKAPVLLCVSYALMTYIMDIEDHDDEEKYMRREFIYDSILTIREIHVLNKSGEVCKIIREADDRTAEVIGPINRLTNDNQPALGKDVVPMLVDRKYLEG